LLLLLIMGADIKKCVKIVFTNAFFLFFFEAFRSAQKCQIKGNKKMFYLMIINNMAPTAKSECKRTISRVSNFTSFFFHLDHKRSAMEPMVDHKGSAMVRGLQSVTL
jgi:hypothetical protein